MYNTELLNNIPKRPGVYKMYNKAGDIIYVGKAKNLFNRVRQYFQSPERLAPKTRAQVKHIERIETIVVDTETEALILECNLIKAHRPRYNIMLKDDKSYPYIKVTTGDYPKIIMTRNHKRDGGKYFGPFTNSTAVRQTIEALLKVYPLRRCNRKVAYGVVRGRPCLNYHIGQCSAPCTGKIRPEDYGKNVDAVLEVLSGHDKALTDRLTAEMQRASAQMDFETAAKLRDQINGIRFVVEKQKMNSDTTRDQDIIAFAKNDDTACVLAFNVRDGKLLGNRQMMMEGAEQRPDSEIITAFVKQYYGNAPLVPGEIVLMCPMLAEERESVIAWLSENAGRTVKITVPQKGKKAALVKMVKKNAELTLEQHVLMEEEKVSRRQSRLDSLKDLLGIDHLPKRVEAYDISNISGSDNVGGMVVFENGRAAPKAYRRFKIKTVEGQNDYGSMQEMIFRRIERGIKEKTTESPEKTAGFLPFPEVFMIDGGKTHVEAAESILSMYPELNIAVCGLVKNDKHTLRGVVFRGEEYAVKYGTPVYSFLNEISEEVHRYAIGYHRTLRQKGMFSSELESIPGVGPKRRAALMRTFGTVDDIKKAGLEQIESIPELDRRSAEAVVAYFAKEEKVKSIEQK